MIQEPQLNILSWYSVEPQLLSKSNENLKSEHWVHNLNTVTVLRGLEGKTLKNHNLLIQYPKNMNSNP
jgi:hypothetical protein